MKNNERIKYILYFNFWYIIIILTFKLFLKELLDKVYDKKIEIPIDFNTPFQNITNLNDNIIIESGELNLSLILQIILYFFIGFKYPKNIVLVLFCCLLNEFLLLYFTNESNLLTGFTINFFSYLLGNLLSNQKYNENINTREYSPYTIY
jgi:hypothetical protein